MIFPVIYGILSFKKVPMTWILFFINLVVFLVGWNQGLKTEKSLTKMYAQESYLRVQGLYYGQFIQNSLSIYPQYYQKLVSDSKEGKLSSLSNLGALAFRDQRFVESINKFSFSGDPVEIEWWKKKFVQISDLQSVNVSHVLGLSSDSYSIFHWVTYQFTHSGFMHFFGNMIFLLVFGSALEMSLGGLFLLLTYLLSGMVGAGLFLLLSGLSAVPLVGASGSISGIIALCCLLYFKKNIRYMYFLFIPRKEYLGYIYLPAGLALIIWLAGDLAGYLGNINELGGIAHTAHIGGSLCGAILFGIIKTLKTRYNPVI